MSKKQLSYYERLGIATAPISQIKELIKNEIKNTLKCKKKGMIIKNQCIRLVGPAGLGKTFIQKQIQKEISKELNIDFGFRLLKAPMITKDDLKLPFPEKQSNKSSSQIWQRLKFLYADMIPIEGRDPEYGIFLIDELQRGDYSLQQMLWQIQDENKVDMEDIPPGWFIICTDNPDNDEYSMNSVDDAAGVRRTLDIGVEVDHKGFLEHAIKNKFHPLVIEWIQIYPNHLYDFKSQKSGSKFACPAIYERVSDQLYKYGMIGEIKDNIDNIHIMLSGLLNINMTRMFMEFLLEKKDISPEDIVFNYTNIRDVILSFVENSDNASLHKVFDSFLNYMSTIKPKIEKSQYSNIATFLTDIPIDTAALYILYIENLNRKSLEYKYMISIQSELMSFSQFKNGFFERMVEISQQSMRIT